MDLYLNESGDIEVSPTGDLAMTQTAWRDDVQQVYVRMMTDAGDWVLHPDLGASLSSLWGLPNSPNTAERGILLIRQALDREKRFLGKQIDVKAVPTGYHTVRFDVYLSHPRRDKIKLSVEQELGA